MSRVRNSAIALAGAACMGLTGAAASVVVSNLDVEFPARTLLDMAVSPPSGVGTRQGPLTPRPGLTQPARVISRGESESAIRHAIPLIASWTDEPELLSKAEDKADRKALSGHVQIDDYYVGASVAPVRTSVLGLNISTNLLHAQPEIGFNHDSSPADTSNTEIHSDVDARRGGVSTVITDPELERTVNVSRKQAM